VQELGAGPAAIPRNHLNAQRLAAAMRAAATDPLVRSRAAELGKRLRAEDGIARGVEVLEGIALSGGKIRSARRGR
jgi:UDP:flavonoid glycosyltransferase YjiC (YdhE family)